MPLPSSRVTIEKMYQGEYWTNVYFLSSGIADALTSANALVAAERAITLSGVLFTKLRVDDNTEDTDIFYTAPINLFGQNTTAGAQYLSLFNVLRVDFAAGAGRPSRKYLRGTLWEAAVNFNTIDPLIVTDWQTNYANVVAGLADYVDVDGDPITSGLVYPFVGMRQLRRASKKKTTPSSPTPV